MLPVQDDFEATALHWAIENNRANAVEMLMEKGADPAILNNCGYAALHLAVQKNALESLRKLLEFKV